MNLDKVETGHQHDGANGEDCEDQHLLSSYWQERFEQFEVEAARVKLLEAELLETSNKLERSERAQQECLEELLRTQERINLLTSNPGLSSDEKDSQQGANLSADHHDKSRHTTTLPPRPDDGLPPQNSNRTISYQPRISSFLDEKIAIANRRSRQNPCGVIGTTSVEGIGGHSFLDEKIAIADRSKGRPKRASGRASGKGSFINLKLARARRTGKKRSSASDEKGVEEQINDDSIDGGAMSSLENVGSLFSHSKGENVQR